MKASAGINNRNKPRFRITDGPGTDKLLSSIATRIFRKRLPIPAPCRISLKTSNTAPIRYAGQTLLKIPNTDSKSQSGGRNKGTNVSRQKNPMMATSAVNASSRSVADTILPLDSLILIKISSHVYTMNKSTPFSGVLLTSIIGGYVLMLFALFFFLNMFSSSGVNVIRNDGSMVQLITDPYLYRNSYNGIIYVLSFSIAGAIFIYVFLLSPVINQQEKAYGIQTKPETGASLLYENVADNRLKEETQSLFNDGQAMNMDKISAFVKQYPEAALLYAMRKNPDGSDIDPGIKKIFRDWENRGLNKQMLIDEIKYQLGFTYFSDGLNFNQTLNSLKSAIGTDNHT
ncbi:hypothetical protein CHS0354_035250 [Potamilus streckersoni]|uniref:Uncharacterized protein n=1 Tax=Potamilus streckersoni TaxID=2493646 RepID=A0AAE0S2V3_9BIVA|nr:hypothetical protein CHS0354_035250 [Potamilus streckersoni]